MSALPALATHPEPTDAVDAVPARSSAAPDRTALTNQAVLTLTRAVRAIQSRPPQPTPESLQTLYGLCEAAVAAGPQTCQLLYDRIRMEIERETGELRKILAGSADGMMHEGQEEKWMNEFEREGKRFLDQVLLIRSIFLQLDRTYVLNSAGLLSIWYVPLLLAERRASLTSIILRDLGLDLFQHSVLADEGIAQRVTSCLLHLVEQERCVLLLDSDELLLMPEA